MTRPHTCTYNEKSGGYTITMKQDVSNGQGYTLTANHDEVKEIVFDSSCGSQSRTLTEEGEHTAETISLANAGTNSINVTEGSKLVAGQMSGSGSSSRRVRVPWRFRAAAPHTTWKSVAAMY